MIKKITTIVFIALSVLLMGACTSHEGDKVDDNVVNYTVGGARRYMAYMATQQWHYSA